MRIHFLSFMKTLSNKKGEFSSLDFKNKNKTLLLNFFETLAFIEKVGKKRYSIYKKTKFFDTEIAKLKTKLDEQIIQLFLVLSILNSDKLPNEQYNGKKLRLQFKSGAKIVTYLLFQSGLFQKQKRSYQYSRLFHHLSQQTKDEKDSFFSSLIEYHDNDEQKLYLTCIRSIRYKPDHLIVSFDHGISLRTQWVLTYWEIGKDHNKELRLQKIAEKNKELIIFEADRATKTAKAFITIFPRLST